MVNIQSKSAHKLETTMIKTIFLLTCCVLFFSFCSAPSQAQKLVNGRCGVASGVATKLPSSTKLCYTGHASAVTGTGSWNWTCAGRNGGSTESCSAPLALLVNGKRQWTLDLVLRRQLWRDDGKLFSSACVCSSEWPMRSGERSSGE